MLTEANVIKSILNFFGEATGLKTNFSKSAIISIRCTEAPGPDGFTGLFYESCWEIIQIDVMAAFDQLYRMDGSSFDKVNSAFITLLPKKVDASDLQDYRPISLLHSFAKLFAKVLSRRLASKLDDLVDNNQSAFIRSRCIHDNFMLVKQLAIKLHLSKTPATLLN